jgi:hypothetical protein
MAANIMPFFIIMCEFFNGIPQPQALMPAIWAYTIYYVGPFTYWISGVVSMILTPLDARCADSELVHFEVPPNTTCAEYAGEWLSNTTGYLVDPAAFGSCGYCQYATGEEVRVELPSRRLGDDRIGLTCDNSIYRQFRCLRRMPGHIWASSRCSPSPTTCPCICGCTSNRSRIGFRGNEAAVYVD